MGLDISHNAFNGSYSAFNRLRNFILKSIGGSYMLHSNSELSPFRWYWREDGKVSEIYNSKTFPGLYEFLCHSDCDGEISPERCKLIADELELLMPNFKTYVKKEVSGGHIERDGGYIRVIEKFIDGCRSAHEVNEPLEFR